MRKTLSFLLAFVMLFSLLAVGASAANVVLSAQKLTCEGKSIECEKYNIDGSNYFKLRDIAYLLNGTVSQFSVGWDAEAKVVSIVTGEAYEPNGSELIFSEDKSSTAVTSSQTIKINGVERSDLSVYNIGGSNFFKLRDLGGALGFLVDYDKASNTAVINCLAEVKNPDKWLIVRSSTCGFDGTVYYTTEYTYNDKKQLISDKDVYAYGGASVRDYTYDAAGNRTSITYSSEDSDYWSKVEYTYDAAGNVLSERSSYPDGVGPATYYSYTADGKKLSKTFDGGEYGNKTEYTYDENGNVLSHVYESYSGAYDSVHRIDYSYDANGRLIKEVESYSEGSEFTTEYTYDAAGNRLTAETKSGDYSKLDERTYDANGNLLTSVLTVVYGAGSEANTYVYKYSYEYDAGNHIISEKYADDGVSSEYSYSYYDNGKVRSREYNDSYGAHSLTGYNSDGNILDYVYEASGYTESANYSYDALGNLLTVRSEMYGTELFTVYSYDYAAGTYTVLTNEMQGYGDGEEYEW